MGWETLYISDLHYLSSTNTPHLSLWLERDHLEDLVARGESLLEGDVVGVPHSAAVDVHAPAVLVPVVQGRPKVLSPDSIITYHWLYLQGVTFGN